MKLRTLKQLKHTEQILNKLYSGFGLSSRKEKMALNEGYLRAFLILRQEATKHLNSNLNQSTKKWIKMFFNLE